MVLQFQAVVQRARKLRYLKSFVRMIQATVHDNIAKMQVFHDRITIRVADQTETSLFRITICSSEWFVNYNLNTRPGRSWSFFLSMQVLCGILDLAHDGDEVTITGNVCQDGSGHGYLIFDFENPEDKTCQTHQMDVRGTQWPNLQNMIHPYADGFILRIMPRSLTSHLEFCNINHESFSLTISSTAVTVVVGRRYRHALTRGIQSDYIIRNVAVEGGGRSYVLTMPPQILPTFNRAVLVSRTIIVKTPPPTLDLQWSVICFTHESFPWFTFPVYSHLSAQ